jgi:hypothetical protein
VRPGTAGAIGLAVIAAAVVVIALSSAWTGRLLTREGRVTSDFQILHAAARGLQEGRDIHDPEVLDALGRQDGRPTTPFCAANPLVLGLVGLLDPDLERAYGQALVANVALALVAVGLLASVLAALGCRPAAAAAIALGVVGLDDGTWMSLAMNSTNLLVLAALAGALRAALARADALEGLLLAVAVVAKTSPALLLVVLLLAGRRRPVAWALVGLALLAGVSIAWSGWSVHASWSTRVLPALGYAPVLAPGAFANSLHAWNLAPNGVLSRAVASAGAPRLLALAGAWLVTLLVLVQLGLSLRAGERGPGASASARLRQYGLGVSATFLVSSVTWPHHLVLAALPATWLLCGASRRPAAALGLLACAVLFLPLGTLGDDPTLTLDIGAKAAACVLLLLATAVPGARCVPAALHTSGVAP